MKWNGEEKGGAFCDLRNDECLPEGHTEEMGEIIMAWEMVSTL